MWARGNKGDWRKRRGMKGVWKRKSNERQEKAGNHRDKGRLQCGGSSCRKRLSCIFGEQWISLFSSVMLLAPQQRKHKYFNIGGVFKSQWRGTKTAHLFCLFSSLFKGYFRTNYFGGNKYDKCIPLFVNTVIKFFIDTYPHLLCNFLSKEWY